MTTYRNGESAEQFMTRVVSDIERVIERFDFYGATERAAEARSDLQRKRCALSRLQLQRKAAAGTE